MDIDENSVLMMSDSLKDSIAASELIKYQNSIILCIISIAVGDAIENVLGSVVSYETQEEHEKIEARVPLADAFGLTEAWPKINIQKYELQLADNVITKQGPYKVSSLAVKEIDFERQMCVLTAMLSKE